MYASAMSILWAAILSTTLSSSWLSDLLPAIFGIIGVTVGGLATYMIEKMKMEDTKYQKRQQVYSQLRGIKFLVTQLTVTLGVGTMLEGYYNSKYKLSKDSKDFDVSEKWRQDTIMNQIELAKCNQNLWEKIGLIELLFPEIDAKITQSKDLIAQSANTLGPFFKEKKKEISKEVLEKNIDNNEDLEELRRVATEEIYVKILEIVDKPLIEILNHMQEEIKAYPRGH